MDNMFNNEFEVNSIDNTIDNSINNNIDSFNDISMDSIENELNNINISYVNDDNKIVEAPSVDLITPQPEESKNLFDIEPSFETKIEEPTFSSVETPVVEDISIPEINASVFENKEVVENNDSFTFDDNGLVSAPTVMESFEPIEETPVTEETEISNNIIDERLKRVIENVNNMNINYAKIKNILENAKVNGIADSEYLKATFEKMAVFDEIMNKFNDKANKYINSRIKGEKEEKDSNLDNMVFMDNKVEEAA